MASPGQSASGAVIKTITSTSKGGLATHTERKSRYLVTGKLENKKSETFMRTSIELFKKINPTLVNRRESFTSFGTNTFQLYNIKFIFISFIQFLIGNK